MDLDQAQVLLGGEALAGFGREGGGGDGFDEELGDFFGGVAVDFAVDADDAAEGGDGVAGEGLLVGLEDGCAGGRAAGVGVLDDDDGGLVEFLGQLPAGVEIDEVVEAEFLALELGCAGDAEAGAVGVEGGALVGVFAVAQRLGEREVDAEGRGKCVSVSALQAAAGRGGFGDLVEGIGDGGVVGGGGGEGLLGEPPAGFAAQCRRWLEFQLFDESGIVGHAGDDGDVFKVLGGGADHGGAADVDVFDQMAEGDAGLGGGFLKGVEIDDDHVDGLDAVGGDGGLVLVRCRECRAGRRGPWDGGS